MPVEYPYTTEDLIVSLAGQLAVDLRLDDSIDAADDLEFAIDAATNEVDFYVQRYSQVDCAASGWVQAHATWFAVRVLCQRRLNDVAPAIEAEWVRREKQLMLVAQRKMDAGGRLAHSRRPIAVTGYTYDGRRYNNQIRVDTNRSTGVAKNYRRPTDPTAPDQR